MAEMTLRELLEKLNACEESLAWAGRRTPKKAWEQCKRADWILWLCSRIGVDPRVLYTARCACARTALPYWEKWRPTDRRPREAIEAREAWCRGEATEEHVAAKVQTAAAAAAANAADAAAWTSARDKALASMAVLVRKIIPWAEVRRALVFVGLRVNRG